MEKEYTGSSLKVAMPDYNENGVSNGKNVPPYIPNKELIEAVKYARLLNRPLLLRGEPGCGKTRLAQAVAYELYGKDYRKYFFEWYVKSTEKATEGLYTYDHLARLRDVQDDSIKEKVPKEEYLSFGPMGNAFQTDRPAVLLIDEIDKASIDFPNDLLLELDQKRFEVKELMEKDNPEKGKFSAKHPPIVFITSNDERDLPNAFLRRCVFHYIKMDKDKWLEIVKAHFSQEDNLILKNTLEDIVDRFDKLVTNMKNGNATKKPDTSELIDWVKTIQNIWTNEKQISEETIKARLKEDTVYFAEVLLKTLEDRQKYSGAAL